MEFRFELPATFGVGRSKLGALGHIYPDIQGRWLSKQNDFQIHKITSAVAIFLTCQMWGAGAQITTLAFDKLSFGKFEYNFQGSAHKLLLILLINKNKSSPRKSFLGTLARHIRVRMR